MKRSIALLSILIAALAASSRAQVLPSAFARQFTVTAGGTGAFFDPDYGPDKLIGLGAFVDVKLTRWAQFEGEARWLRFHQYENIYEDNYLAGPRIPIRRIWKGTAYGKAMIGYGIMNFQDNYAHGRFTDAAFGGGLDIRMTRRISIRAIDAEYQLWPKWVQGSLKPYGFSAGVSYRVFGGR
jgi:hypothetical protein